MIKALLEQVIYHLNNKNEDNDFDQQDLVDQYEAEIEQILKESNDKIAVYKQQLEAASDERRIAEMRKVGQLRRR